MMGHITKQTDIWQQYSKLRVKGIARNEAEIDFVRGFLENLTSNVRIKSRVEVITLNSLDLPLYNEAVESHGLQEDGSNFEAIGVLVVYSEALSEYILVLMHYIYITMSSGEGEK